MITLSNALITLSLEMMSILLKMCMDLMIDYTIFGLIGILVFSII